MDSTQGLVGPERPRQFGYERVIEPPRGLELNLRELARERELLGFLTKRNIQVRYKQSVAGPGWAVLQPALSMLLFTLVFGRLAKLPNDGIPYPVFYYTGFVIWAYVASAVTMASGSIVENAPMVSKIYFPRIFLPLGAGLAGLLDVAIASLVGLPLLLAYGVDFGLHMLLVPVPILIAALATTGAGVFLGGLNARYRDVRLAVPFAIQIGLFTSPVAFSSSMLPDDLETLYGLNPVAGAIEGFRWCMTGEGAATPAMVAISFATSVLIFLFGIAFFQRTDASIADVV